MNRILLPLATVFILSVFSCKKEVETITPMVKPAVNPELGPMPYQKLSDYGFFKGDMKNQIPEDELFSYEPISSLFTDYAKKKRFIQMPEGGGKATFVEGDKLLDFPTGTILIKNFYYDNVLPGNITRIIETRLLIKETSGWIFAEYVWNDEQTEAYLDMNGSYTEISWMENGVQKSTNYRIPSETECLICHKFNSNPIPIGVKPQHMNKLHQYTSGMKNQLQEMVDKGYLEGGFSENYASLVDYKDQSEPVDLRLRSYLDINCAHCHSENSHCDYRPLRLAYSETTELSNLGVCVEPDEQINSALVYIVAPSNTTRSVMHFRLSSTSEATRMPLLGRSIVHEEGVQLLEEWINTLSPCGG